jgi:spermidine synthase
MSRLERIALRTAVFAAGALLMALEVAAFRIIGKTFGTALRETTTVIAVFLAAMSAGYWAGGRVADRRPLPATLVATLVFAAASLLAVPWIDAAFSPRIASSGLALATHAFVATSILFAIPAFLLAATSPIAIRLFATSTGESGSTAGSISAISTAGSIAGSLITAFFLIDWLASITRTVLFVALGTALTAVLVVLAGRGPLRRGWITVAAAAIGAVCAVVYFRSTSLDRVLASPVPGTRMLYVGDSPYHRLTVRDRGVYRELYFNIAKQSRMRVADPSGPGLSYTAAFHIAPLMRPAIRRVLMIGLGGGTSVKQYLRDYPDVTIDAVEVDPLVVTVAKRWFAVPESDRLHIHIADGRTFLKRSSERWDLIIVDAYTTNRYGDTIPAHLTTREFFGEVRGHLAAAGVVHFHCAFQRSLVLAAIERTLRSGFASVVRTEGELLASDVPLVLDRAALAAKAKTSPVAGLPALDSAIAGLTADPLPPSNAPLLTDDYAPVDTLIYGR